MKNLLLIVILATGSLALTTHFSSEWFLTDDYMVKFTSENPSGVFTSLEGTIVFDENDLAASRFNMIIDVASIDTGNGLKNKHARGKKWFDIEKYPSITFASSAIETDPAGGYVTTGMLEIRGVNKEVTIPFTFEDETFKGELTVNRRDYNLGPENGMMAKAAYDLLVEIAVPVQKSSE